MRLLAALAVGTTSALLVGHLSGVLPLARRPRAAARRGSGALWLRQAGVALGPVQFWLGSALVGLLTLVGLGALTGSLLVAVVPAVAVAWLPRAYFARRRRGRLRQVADAWPDGLRDLVASVSAGRSVTQAVASLATVGPEPLREAFDRFPEQAAVLGTVPALEVVQERLADPVSDRVLEVLVLAHERGGGIVATILGDLATATTNDLKVLDAVETESLEMRINARAVVVLPWLVLVALTAGDGPFREFYRSAAGAVVLGVGAALSAVGALVVARLARPPGEDRVFGSSRSAR